MQVLFKIVYSFFLLGLFFFGNVNAIAQEGFQLPNGKKSDKMSFKLINNLVVIPVELNGVALTFLLDTGVDKTVLFGINVKDSIEINNAERIQIRGWGDEAPKEALKSYNNILKLGKTIDYNHTLYVVFDEMIDFSQYMGIPIHGIIGYDYFKNFEVTIKYDSKRILTKKSKISVRKPCRKCDRLSLEFYNNKPYLALKVNKNDPISMLIDSGSSDAVWLFEANTHIKESPKNYFRDFLGYTLSGAIFGKRSRVERISLGKFIFEDITTAFPEDIALDGLDLKKGRGGSIGGELLSRFTTIIDYPNEHITLKKNSRFKRPFNYDLSGMTLIYNGSYQVKELQDVKNDGLSIALSGNNKNSVSRNTVRIDPVYQLFTAPKVVIAELRDNSPAALAGMQINDAIIKINGAFSYRYELYEINALLRQEEGKKISIEYERGNQLLKTSFRLRKQM